MSQAAENWNLEYPPESVILRNKHGVEVRTRAFPGECDYLRIVIADAEAEDKVTGKTLTGVCEIVYWDSDEWKEDPKGVMGAVMGAIKRVVENDSFEVEFGYKAFE